MTQLSTIADLLPTPVRQPDAGERKERTALSGRAPGGRPRVGAALLNLGNALAAHGELAAAADSYRALLRHAPQQLEAQINLGQGLRVLGGVGGARARPPPTVTGARWRSIVNVASFTTPRHTITSVRCSPMTTGPQRRRPVTAPRSRVVRSFPRRIRIVGWCLRHWDGTTRRSPASARPYACRPTLPRPPTSSRPPVGRGRPP